MKIALCLSGQPRFVKECYDSTYEAILDGNDVDVFVHTWHNPENVGKEYDAAPGRFVDKESADIVQVIKELYNPKAIAVEPQVDFIGLANKIYSAFNTNDPILCRRYISMFYSIQRANELKQDKYDCVIRSRFDNLFPTGKIDFNVDLTRIHTNGFWNRHHFMCDMFAFSNPYNMDAYSTVFSRFSSNGFLEKHKILEYYIWKQLREKNIIIADTPIKLYLKRVDWPVYITSNVNNRKYCFDPNWYPNNSNIQDVHYQTVLERLFGIKDNGVFVEIGGYDGESRSACCGLADFGWQGYFVEPIKAFADKCRVRHKDNKVVVDECAIGKGELNLFVDGAYTTAKKEWVDYCKRWNLASHSSEVKVMATPLNDYLTERNVPVGFDILSINCEGMEYEILKDFNIKQWMPKLVIMDLPGIDDEYFANLINLVSKYFSSNGYKLLQQTAPCGLIPHQYVYLWGKE